MTNYIGADGQFINLAAIVMIEDDTPDAIGEDVPESVAVLTTIGGAEIELKGEDADNLFARLELLTLETEAAAQKLRAFIQANIPEVQQP